MARFAIIGLGRFGMKLARSLTAAGAEVIAIDANRDLIEQIRDEVPLAIRLDSTDAQALLAQGIDKVDAAVVGIGQDFESAALTTATLKSIGVRKVIARAGSEVRGKILKSIGADEIVFPEAESATRWANRLTLPELHEYLELGPGYSLIQIKAPKAFCNKTLGQIHLRRRYHVNLVAIRRKTDTAPQIISVPHADTTILPDDILVLVGSDENLASLPGD